MGTNALGKKVQLGGKVETSTRERIYPKKKEKNKLKTSKYLKNK